MKKNITFLIPSMNGGGAEKVTMLLANELNNRGWKVTILLSKLEGPYLNKLKKEIRIIVLKKRNISKNIFEIASYLKSENPDIVYSSMMYVNVIAGLAAKLCGFKGRLFFSEHSHVSMSLITNKSRNFTMQLILGLARLLYKYADAVICVSEGVKNDLVSKMKTIKNAIVIYNPIESFALAETKENASKYRIISMGRLVRDKNFKLLIQSFAEVLNEVGNKENYELYILGEGDERGNLEKLIKDKDLQNLVFLPGFVDDPGDLLRSSSLFVFPSLIEGLPSVLIEALSSGLPVISADCPTGPAEILQYGKIGKLVPVDDLESLKTAIIEEIRHPDMVSTKEQRMERAKDFSVENIVDKYEKIFLN